MTEREEFEAAYSEKFGDYPDPNIRHYIAHRTGAWWAWQAAKVMPAGADAALVEALEYIRGLQAHCDVWDVIDEALAAARGKP